MEATVIAFGTALVIGLSLGLLGGGGSILTVPVLVYALGFDVKPAVAMSLILVGLTSLVGAVVHWRLGNVRLPSAALFAVLAMTGAFAGARLSALVPSDIQLALLALVMLAASVAMFRRPSRQTEAAAPRVAPRHAALVPVAIGVGLLTGLLVVVPVNWAFIARFTAVAAAGAFGGAAMIRLVSVSAFRRSFAVLLLAVGFFVLSKNLVALGDADKALARPRHLPETATTH